MAPPKLSQSAYKIRQLRLSLASSTASSTLARVRPASRFTKSFNSPRDCPAGRSLVDASTRHFPRSFSSMAPISKSMSGIRMDATGDHSVLQWRTDLPIPDVKEGEILVRHEFVGLNYIDTYFRRGIYPKPLPFTPGAEAAGVVEGVHESVKHIKPGDKVGFIAMTGAYAQYSAISASSVYVLPPTISTEVAASALMTGLTSLTMIREAVGVQAGQWILIHAAAGGVGSVLVQMASALGAKVIGTVGSDEKAALARANGAAHVVNTRTEDWVARVKEITGGAGVNGIFDGVGAATFEGDLEVGARKATIAMFGAASGPVPPVNVLRLGGTKNYKLCRPVVFAYLVTPEERAQYGEELFSMVTEGKIKFDVSKVYDLQDAAQAQKDLEGRLTTGKVILKVPA